MTQIIDILVYTIQDIEESRRTCDLLRQQLIWRKGSSNYIRTWSSRDQVDYFQISYPKIEGIFVGLEENVAQGNVRESMYIHHLVFYAFSTNIELVMTYRYTLDHINRFPSDSRWINLRAANEQMQNDNRSNIKKRKGKK